MRNRLPVALRIILWTAVSSLAGALTGFAASIFRAGAFEPTIVLISVLFGNVIGFTVFLMTIAVSPRVRDVGPVSRAIAQMLTLISGSVVGTVLVLYLFPLFVLRDTKQAAAVLAINGALALIVGSVVSIYENLRARLSESLREVEEVRLVEARLKEHAAQAELAALQARINPHFFFNTLNTISSLLGEDPERADEVLQKLATLFRYTFKATDTRPIALSEEMDFINDYLEIERARFGDRLAVRWEIEPAALGVPVPGLVLQPLVENAISHGLASLPEGGMVTISAHVFQGALIVEVSDDGIGLKGNSSGLIREGHGLGNILSRLKNLYRRDGTIELLPGPDGRGDSHGRGALSRLRIPIPKPDTEGRA